MTGSKKQTAVSGVLLFIIIFGAYIVGFVGWGSPKASTGVATQCNSPASILQCGTVTFTLSAATSNTQTITFSPAFASIPAFGLTMPNKTPVTWPSTTLTAAGPLGTYCFICPTNTGISFAWTNMPAATTEIFGDANREHQIFSSSPIPTSVITGSTFRAAVNCNAGSNSGTAILEIQWSTDDATWNDLANTAGQADIPIDAAVNCPAAGTIIPALSGNSVTLNTNFPGSGNKVYFRVVGINGGGLGDVPAFEWIDLTIRAPNLSIVQPCVLDMSTALTATSVTVRLRCFATATLTIAFAWTAQL